MSKVQKILLSLMVFLVVVVTIFSLAFKKNEDEIEEGKLDIVTTSFSSYDFAKQLVGDKGNVTFLLGPGVDAHSYEPSASDLIKIQNADVFIYIGGEMEKWTDKVLDANTLDISKTTLIKISDAVNRIAEKEVDGAEPEEEEEEEGAFDEHIWTSPSNSIDMLEYMCSIFCTIDPENAGTYVTNSNSYRAQIEDVQAKITEIVANRKRDRLVFGDKMPMQYFLDEYGLVASAAFNGCSTETEPSAKTIAYLINKVKEENIPVVLYVELSTGKTAKTIAEETGAEAMQIQSLHNVSKTDFDNGETYVSLMTRNLEVLKKALQ